MSLLNNLDFHIKVLDVLDNKQILPETDCWIYTGEIEPNGYGRVMILGIRYNTHRLSAAAFLGLDLLDNKQFACHTCSNRACFNPKHLYVGDNQTNQLDVVQDLCKKGHPLTEDNIILNKTTKRDGSLRVHRLCRICHNERSKRNAGAYYQKNKEKILERGRTAMKAKNQLLKEVLRELNQKTTH